MAVRLLKSRFNSPYKGEKSNLSFCKDKPGVYLIKEVSSGQIVYIGYSAGNLEKTCLRHFQSWDDKRQVRVSYRNRDNYTVRVIATTAARAELLERSLIIKIKPRDNPNKLKAYEVTKAGERLMAEYEREAFTPISDPDTWEAAPF